MKTFILIIFLSFKVFSEDLNKIIEACELDKENPLCQELIYRKKTIEENSRIILKEYYLDSPLSILGWLNNPTFYYKSGNHKLILQKEKTMYVYEF